MICNAKVSKREVKRHLQKCLEKSEGGEKAAGRKKSSTRIFHLLVEGYGLSGDRYWMHLKALGSAKFRDLDMFLRNTWLECCGHMSVFSAGEEELDMNEKLSDILSPGQKWLYEYDMGSTTELALNVVSEFEGTLKKGKVEILARNDAPRIICNTCENPATTICMDCIYVNQGFLCDDCAGKHGCDEEMFLPLVNSPRTGVCGYEG
jgi:hypothetical protein